MSSTPDYAITIHAEPAAMPAEARALMAGDFFATPAWYTVVVQAGLAPGTTPAFVVVSRAGAPCAIFPMQRTGRRLAALTTPYTCLWSPALAPQLDDQALAAIGRHFAHWCRGRGVIRLDALDLTDPSWAPLRAGMRGGGVSSLPFDHFGNWVCEDIAAGWPAYLAARPGQLREAIRRRTKQLTASGATLLVIDGPAGLDAGIGAYEAVYAKSWKQAEPFPQFNAALMRACAADGTLRLAILQLNDAPVAVQFWVVQGHRACVLKLAHDEDARALSPGTVLTALMIRRLIEQDHVTTLDFGRGDDDYKQLWTDRRRPRSGLLLVNPWHPLGFVEMLRAGVSSRLSGRKQAVLF